MGIPMHSTKRMAAGGTGYIVGMALKKIVFLPRKNFVTSCTRNQRWIIQFANESLKLQPVVQTIYQYAIVPCHIVCPVDRTIACRGAVIVIFRGTAEKSLNLDFPKNILTLLGTTSRTTDGYLPNRNRMLAVIRQALTTKHMIASFDLHTFFYSVVLNWISCLGIVCHKRLVADGTVILASHLSDHNLVHYKKDDRAKILQENALAEDKVLSDGKATTIGSFDRQSQTKIIASLFCCGRFLVDASQKFGGDKSQNGKKSRKFPAPRSAYPTKPARKN